MEATAIRKPFNEAQLFVLKTLATANSEETRDELTQLYLNYIRTKLDEATERWWEENDMTNEKFNAMFRDVHYRTPYK